MEHYVKNFPLPPIQKFPRHAGFSVKSQISIGGGGEEKERMDVLRAGQSRGSIVCVNGVMHSKA